MIFTRNGKQILRDGEHFADCVDEAAALTAWSAIVNQNQVLNVVDRAHEVMAALETHGPSIVPHLLDTDDNAGQRLRESIHAVRFPLGDEQ